MILLENTLKLAKVWETADRPRNTWIAAHEGEIYLRVSWRMGYEGKRVRLLDIANIQISKKLQGKGFFTRYLEGLEEAQPLDGLYIENVLDDRLAQFFERRGYERIDFPYGGKPSYRKIWERDEKNAD